MGYIFIFFINGIVLFIKKKYQKIVYLFLTFFYIFYFGTAMELGKDYFEYKKMFEMFENSHILSSPIEKGYLLFISFVKYCLSGNFQVFIFFNTLIIFLLIFKAIPYYTNYILLSLLFFLRGEAFSSLGGSRQGLASMLYFYSLIYLLKNKNIKYFILNLVGLSFHRISLLFYFTYFIIKKQYKTLYLKYFILFSIGLYFVDLKEMAKKFLYFLPYSYQYKYLYYFENENYMKNRGLSINMIISLGVVFLLLKYREKLEEKYKYFNIMLNNYILGIFVSFGLNSVYVLSYRLSQIFQIYDAIIYTYIFYIFSKKNKILKYFLLILFILYSYISFSKNYLTYNKKAYSPYKNYFFRSEK